MSRTALREAIKVLAAKGLVEVRRKTGTRVRPNSQWNMFDPEVLLWLFSGPRHAGRSDRPAGSQKDCGTRRGAYGRRTRDAGRSVKMESAFKAMEVAANDLDSRIEPDLLFHLAVLEGTRNAFMRPFGSLIQTALRRASASPAVTALLTSERSHFIEKYWKRSSLEVERRQRRQCS